MIGADPRIVRHAIAHRYREAIKAAAESAPSGQSLEASDQLIRDYVEKLIQIPYHLPRLSPAEIETYMTLLFSKRHLGEIEFEQCLAACDEQRVRNRFSSFGLGAVRTALKGDAVDDELIGALSFVAGASPLITENLNGNPRQVKRFLNAFVLRQRLAKVAQMESCKDDVLLKLMLLEYAKPSLFRELSKWQEQQSGTPVEIVSHRRGRC